MFCDPLTAAEVAVVLCELYNESAQRLGGDGDLSDRTSSSSGDDSVTDDEDLGFIVVFQKSILLSLSRTGNEARPVSTVDWPSQSANVEA